MNLPSLSSHKTPRFDQQVDKFNLGTVKLVKENRLPPSAAADTINLIQVQDGIWAPKYGSKYYTIATTNGANIDGAFEVVNPDGTTELLEAAGGALYRSKDGGTKTSVTFTTGSLTAGKDVFFKQIHGYCYIANGFDALIRYDTTTKTCSAYTALTSPTGLALVRAGLTAGNINHYYSVVATNLIGMTTPGTEVNINTNLDRDMWASNKTTTNTTNTITLTWNRVTGATRYDIYYSNQSGYGLFLDSITDPGSGATQSYVDDGSAQVNIFVETPNDNTTTGPKFTQMELSNNRLWATGDPNNPWRVYWAGVGQYTGTFSPYYGGGYIDLELGGRERPSVVEHYRDGKGTAFATVLSNDPEGNGATWQVGLDTTTIGTTSFITPSATKIVGSVGCTSPRGAAKVKDDIVFGNNKGLYSLGSKPNLLNVLSTNEISANLRPIWRALAGTGMKKFVIYAYDAKVFCAVPNASTSNSEIWIYDTEKQNWQPGWTGIAVKDFVEYTDSSGSSHLMVVPVTGTKMIELSPDIKGDLGTGFKAQYKSAIIPVDKDHSVYAKIDHVYVELGNAVGTIQLDVYGNDYKKGFVQIGSPLIISGAGKGTAGWGTQAWSSTFHSDTSILPTTVTSSITRKRTKRIGRKVSNLQYVITSYNLGDYWELLQLQAKGHIVVTRDPSSVIRTS
jgi:hypothetical protein